MPAKFLVIAGIARWVPGHNQRLGECCLLA